MDAKPYELEGVGRRALCEPCAERLEPWYHPQPPRPEWVKRAADHRLPGKIVGGLVA